MRSKSIESQEVREIFRKEANELSHFLILWRGIVNTVNLGYKRFRYKGFSLIRDYAKGPK